MHTKTKARFWIFYNGDFVKLTLAPGKMLTFGFCKATDEGWTAEAQTFTHCGDHITRQWMNDGADCDGRLSEGGECFCPVAHLASRIYDGDLELRHPMPTWQDAGQAYQRDYAAEAAGY